MGRPVADGLGKDGGAGLGALRAAAAGAFIVVDRGRQVQPAWPCGGMTVPVVARYWPDAGDADDGVVANFTLNPD